MKGWYVHFLRKKLFKNNVTVAGQSRPILLMQMQGTATLQGRQQETLQHFKRNLSGLCLPKYILQM